MHVIWFCFSANKIYIHSFRIINLKGFPLSDGTTSNIPQKDHFIFSHINFFFSFSFFFFLKPSFLFHHYTCQNTFQRLIYLFTLNIVIWGACLHVVVMISNFFLVLYNSGDHLGFVWSQYGCVQRWIYLEMGRLKEAKNTMLQVMSRLG